MPFVAINASNLYDASNLIPYVTQEQADTRAREILQQFPAAQVLVAKVLSEYRATVTVTVQDPAEPEAEAPAA
ncbi:MAG: hypothetical protein ACTMIS_13870 [Pseudomonas putida]|jgi:hypothetical protein|uniref:Uncharacterized protein n=1 Tax=Pseudomonas putida TaxID=303 RepID=A0AAW6PKI7_PSEPU|nr:MULTISPECIES: hypothetical protein [Pseudomonas]MDF3869214.1 hypothetical protein [Pseudomonas putida]MDF3875186.1 hypothetical protein [Pseudomonas putida]RJT93670.1 hypothetical protein D6T65_17720 [Arthrobacter frigidicola]HEN8726682.1 hypothetical protein [Pseudomonas putida]